MKRKLLVAGVVLAAAALTACVSSYGGPRTVQTRTDFVTNYTPGMTVETPTMFVTSPPENNGSLSVRYSDRNFRGSYGRRSYKQVGSTDPGWWLR